MLQCLNSSLRPFHTAIALFERPLTEETFNEAWTVLTEAVNSIEISAKRMRYAHTWDSPYAKPMADICKAFNLISRRPVYLGYGVYKYMNSNYFNHEPVKAETICRYVLSYIKAAEQAYARMVY